MAGLILGKAYEPGLGICLVEQIKGDTFMLTSSTNQRVIRNRSRIQWRKNAGGKK